MQYRNPRLLKNNFDLLRLLFAGTVCLVHTYELSGFQQLRWIRGLLSSEVAIKSFFVVSGFLIFMSYEKSESISSYTKKRFRRIYPAYCTIILFCAFGLLAVSSKSVIEYFSSVWLKYTIANLTFMNFLQLTLPGVFESNRLPFVNGALWTLKIEVMFYAAVPIFVFLFRRLGGFKVIVTIYLLSVGYSELLTKIAENNDSSLYMELSRQLPGQLSYFMAGAFLFYYLSVFERYIIFFLTGAVMALSIDYIFQLPLLEPFALAVIVVFFGLFLYLGNFGKYGDFSYGIYIIHFPVIQLLLHSGWFQHKPWLFLSTVMMITITGAIAMWHIVEKRFLLRNSHYIMATKVSPNHSPDFLHQQTRKTHR